MSDPLPNLEVVARNFALMRNTPPDSTILADMFSSLKPVMEQVPQKPVAGIDSSDNLLLSIPDHLGAAVAGYSFALVITDSNGNIKHIQERMAERSDTDQIEDLEISLVYNIPLPDQQKLLHISDYQLRILIHTPSGQSPYGFIDQIPEYKVRFAAAKQRETIERRATRNAFFQPDASFGLFLKEGRLNSQNVSTRYTDDIGRKAVERGIRYVGVVKAGTLLWSTLYPYHKAIYQQRQSPYWVVLPPKIILQAYGATMQAEFKTLRLGAQENRCLGGIGGTWVLYGNGPSNFFILEFNVYDLKEFKDLVSNGTPLERFNNDRRGWDSTYIVSSNEDGSYIGTQTLVSAEDLDYLIAPTIGEIHYLTRISYISPGYPIVLADAHNRCKITKDRKEQINIRLIARLRQLGFHPVDFETWSEDPHKTFADN